jgi:hypothetical protein
MQRGLIVAAVQSLMVLSLAGKFVMDRASLPRVWVKATPVDPNLPIRGRYVSLQLEVARLDKDSANSPAVRLAVENGRLVARETTLESHVHVWPRNGRATISEPVAFFIPEHVADPSRRAPGEELWVEASIPRLGPPRPIRLAVKKDGVLTPLEPR